MSTFSNLFFHLKGRVTTLFSYLSRFEKYLIYTLLGIIFISILLLGEERFLIKRIEVPSYGGSYTEGVLGEVRFLMPILNQNEAEQDIDKLVFSGLTKFNEKDEILPDLAEKWEILDEGKTYKFYLKEAKWHDGKPITADDVIFTFLLIKNKETKSPYFENLKEIEIGKIDEKTFTLSLKTPLSSFLASLDILILPQHLLENVRPGDLSTSSFAKKPTGSGPFKIQETERNGKLTSVTLLRNEDYFVKKPYLSKFILKVYQESEDLESAFEAGRVLAYLGEKQNRQNNRVTLHRYTALFFNLKHLKNKDFRKALAYSINRDEFSQEISGEKIYYPILPGDLGYKEAEKIDYDPELAKQFFAKVKNPPSSLKLLLRERGNIKVVEILKKQLEVLGITIELESAFNSRFEELAQERNYDLVLVGLDQKQDPDPYPFWHSNFASSGLNFSSFQNKEVDKLLEEGRKTTNADLRRQKYEKFVEIIQAEAPAVFLYRRFYYYNHSSIIKGVSDVLAPSKSDRFWNIENWFLKSKRVKKE